MWTFKYSKPFINLVNSIVLLLAVSCNGTIGEISSGKFSDIFQNNITMIASDITITEGDSTALLLSFSDPAPADFTLRWTISGTGVGTDFPVTTGTISVAKGQETISRTILSNDNLISDGTRVYTLTFESVDGTVMNPKDVNYTVNDDEPSSVPSVTILDVTQAEGTGAGNTTYTFNVGTSFTPGLDVHLDYATSNGTATSADADYIPATGSITIPAGSNSATITVDVPRDAKFEPTETFTLTLSGGSGYSTVGSTLVATGTITNDDTAPTISLSAPTVAEGTGAGFTTLSFDVTLAQASGVNVVVNYNTTDGTATLADSDYVTASSTLTIPAGSTSGSISINVIRDTRFEADETMNLTLSGGSGYTAGGSVLTNTGTITNDDTEPTISIADVTVNEGNGAGTTTMTYTVTLSGASGAAVVVDYATTDGTATTGDSDYTTASGTLTIPAGSTTGTFNVLANRDAKYEPNETYTVTLSGGSGYTSLGSTLSATGTITNDDTGPTISIANVTNAEGTGAGTTTYTYTVTLSAASGSAVSVDYATSNNTATTGDSDYVAASGTVTVPAGSTTGTFTVTVNEDAKFEANETFNVTLSGGSGYTVAGSTLSATGTITNDDTAPTISIANVTNNEGNSGSTTYTFTVTLAQASGVAVAVDYATSNGTATTGDSDYTTATGTVNVAAGATTGTFTVSVAGDAKFEPNEAFTVTLSGGSGYTAAGSTLTATGTITNDDTEPTISIANVSTAEGNGAGTTTMTYTVTLSAASGSAVSVDYATSDGTATTADSDYATASGTLTVPAGSTTGTFDVTVNRDAKNEANETYTVTLSGGSGYTVAGSTLTATGTITNDDSAPTISIANVTNNEGTGGTTTSYTFTVTLSAASGIATTVDYATSDGTATTADSDYATASGTATIPAGSTTATFNVLANHDAKFEGNETFTVTLSGGSGYTVAGSTLTATGTLTNDDTSPTISVANVTVNEGNTGTTTFTFTVTLSAASGSALTVDYATSNGTATLADTDYITASSTLTIPAGSTTGTFDISVVGDTRYESNEAFTITLSGGSGYTVAGSTLTASGNITNDDAVPTISVNDVTITEGTGAGTTTMAFTITQSAVSGLATTVNYTTASWTANSGTDFTAASGTATIAVGTNTATVNVTITRDSTDEDDETFSLSLSGGANYNSTGSDLTGGGTITDDDNPPTISIGTPTAVTEGGTLSFPVTLSAASGKTINFDFATASGTATSGSDFTNTTVSSQPITAGSTSINITVNTADDVINCETSETLTGTISNFVNATAGTPLSATGTINENDIPSFSLSDATVNEGNTATITLTNAVACPTSVSFNYATKNNQALAGQDFSQQQNSFTLPANQLTTTFNITTINDAIKEATETFFVRVNGNAVGTFTKPAATITISDDDGGTGIAKIKTGPYHACALSNAGEVKCWGNKLHGRLGYGEWHIGNNPGEMGNNLRDVNLGTGLEPIKVAMGDEHTCVLLSDGTPNHILKCWGDNGNGVLGYGNTDQLGETPSEMGDNLPAVDLGTNRYAVDVCTGVYANCALLDNGDAKCWGYGMYGSLGNGDTATRGDGANEMGDNLLKVNLGAGITATKIQCGDEQNCVLGSDGKVRCFGRTHAVLGNETGASQGSAPGVLPTVDLGPTISAIDLALGTDHACALVVDSSDGKKKVKCWGVNTYGQLGQDSTLPSGGTAGTMGVNLPFTNLNLGVGEEPLKIWVGTFHSCAEITGGKIRCWGASYSNGSATSNKGTAAGQMNTLADLTFPPGLTVQSFNPVSRANCYIAVDGSSNKSMRCFGINEIYVGQGDLSTPTGWLSNASVTIDIGSGTPIALANSTSRADHNCVIIDNGVKDVLRCWGSNKFGQLGRADLYIGDEPNEMGTNLPAVNLGLDGSSNPLIAQDIALGTAHTCALMTNGSVKCWGHNLAGQLGIGTTNDYGDSDQSESVENLSPINLGAGRTAIALGIASSTTCTILDNYELKCWGMNNNGQIGIGTSTNQSLPQATGMNLGTNRYALSINGTNAISTTSASHLCSVLDNDTVKCWGPNSNGELGLNTATTAHVGDGANEMGDNLPAINMGVDGSSVPYIPAYVYGGKGFSCSIFTDGNVKCWGINLYGTLGINSTAGTGSVSQATVASTILTDLGQPATMLSLAAYHSCAILNDGSLKCWGNNASGNLGYGNTANKGLNATTSAMATVGTVNLGSGVTAVELSASGGNSANDPKYTCAILSTGVLKCWGGNSAGNLGYGDVITRGTIGTETPDQLPAVDLGW